MKTPIVILLLLIVKLSSGQSTNEWTKTSGINFTTYNGDTIYYGGEGNKSIWRIKKGNKLYEYYPNGNIQSVSEIKLKKSFILIDTNKVEKKVDEYVLQGKSEIFYKNRNGVLAAKGLYDDNEAIKEWKYYNIDGEIIEKSYQMLLWRRSDYYDNGNHIIKQIDRIKTLDGRNVKVREVLFKGRKEVVTYNKTLFAKIYYRFTKEYMIVVFFFMFSRVFINSRIYNRENGTKLSPIYFYIGPFVSKNYEHSIMCTFTFWFFKYKPENKRLVYISNTFSLITLILFFGAIIGLAISGEI